ncbi:acyl-CoA dehydrogenase family protein [Rhodococcus olei]
MPPPTRQSDRVRTLRLQVRGFLTDQRDAGAFVPRVDSWGDGWDESFSRALADQGWVGMTIPTEYDGGGRSFGDRFAVTEELLAAGAPVSAHWVADRQIAPSLLKFGTDHQKQTFLPEIAAGRQYWAIGMSEPGSGSDLASVRTKATRAEGGWRLSGTKVWTSGAHRAHYMFVLARSAPLDPARRHDGLSQFIVALDSPGLTVSPILNIAGTHHFNEVLLDEVFVPDEMVLGDLGAGWHQVTSELGYERSGPERFLSSLVLLRAALNEVGDGTLEPDPRLGAAFARIHGLHHMSASVAQTLESGADADTPAAIVKLLGTRLEGDIVDVVDELTGPELRGPSTYSQLLRSGVLARPGFTIRGGTTEILRGVVTRGMGLR